MTGLPLGAPGISLLTDLADNILTLALVLALYFAWHVGGGRDERACRRAYARRARQIERKNRTP